MEINFFFLQYFKVLLIRGFIECRRHCEKIIFLVEMMQEGFFFFFFFSLFLSDFFLYNNKIITLIIGSNMPCFVGGQAAVDLLRQRFNLGATEDEYIQFVEVFFSLSSLFSPVLLIRSSTLVFFSFLFFFFPGVDYKVMQ